MREGHTLIWGLAELCLCSVTGLTLRFCQIGEMHIFNTSRAGGGGRVGGGGCGWRRRGGDPTDRGRRVQHEWSGEEVPVCKLEHQSSQCRVGIRAETDPRKHMKVPYVFALGETGFPARRPPGPSPSKKTPKRRLEQIGSSFPLAVR